MKWLLALSLSLPTSGLMDATVTKSAPCQFDGKPHLCAIVEKDGDTFFVILDEQGIRYEFYADDLEDE